LFGVWHVETQSIEEKRRLGLTVGEIIVPGMEPFTTSKYASNMLLEFKQGEIVMSPEAEARRKAERNRGGAGLNCLPLGNPRETILSELFKIAESPGLTLVMLELDNMTRKIYTDGRPLPPDPSRSWQGYSIGHWDKDTFVVETIGFNGKTFLDGTLHPISERMRMTERYTRRDMGHLDIEWTFDDPPMYNRAFSVKIGYLLQPDTDILEYVCAENERDSAHVRG
jgi:hypothetical protein